MKINYSKVQVATRIVLLMKKYHTGRSMPFTIGINTDGNVDYWHNVQQHMRQVEGVSEMAFAIYDTESESVFACDDDPAVEELWEDVEFMDGLVQAFATTWIDESIRREGNIQVEWP